METTVQTQTPSFSDVLRDFELSASGNIPYTGRLVAEAGVPIPPETFTDLQAAWDTVVGQLRLWAAHCDGEDATLDDADTFETALELAGDIHRELSGTLHEIECLIPDWHRHVRRARLAERN